MDHHSFHHDISTFPHSKARIYQDVPIAFCHALQSVLSPFSHDQVSLLLCFEELVKIVDGKIVLITQQDFAVNFHQKIVKQGIGLGYGVREDEFRCGNVTVVKLRKEN